MSREDLLRRIREVFPDPVWPKHQLAAYEDSGDLDCRYIAEHYQGKRWTEIADEELGWMSQDSWAFSQEARQFFFPAWLAYDVRLGEKNANKVWQLTLGNVPAVNWLTKEQARVAHQALILVYGDHDGWEEDDPFGALLLDLRKRIEA